MKKLLILAVMTITINVASVNAGSKLDYKIVSEKENVNAQSGFNKCII